MKVLSNYKTSLSASLTKTQTTIAVVSIETSDDTKHKITKGDFDSVAYATIEPGSTNIELIRFTGITDNGDGSGSFTGVTRGLAFFGESDTSVTANTKTHHSGSTIILSNVHRYYDNLVDTDSTDTISGIKTFTALPESSVVPTTGGQLTNKTYVDQTATGTTVIAAIVVPGNAGETISDGDLVFFDSVTNNEWMQTDANVANKSTNVLIGVAQGAGTNGNAISGGILLLGQDDAQSGMTTGEIQYLSDTAGDISNSAGTENVAIGIARSATVLYFNPRFQQQLTQDQIDALVGSSGVISTSNKYVTEDDVSNAAASAKIVRATGTSLPALSGFNITSVRVAALDIDTATQGQILERGATTVTIIAPGASGQFLTSRGSGSSNVWVTVSTATVPAVVSSWVSVAVGNNATAVSLNTYTVPGGLLGAFDGIRWTGVVTPSTAGAVARLDVASTAIWTSPGLQVYSIVANIFNRNSVSSQYYSVTTTDDAGTSDHFTGTLSVNTASDFTIVIEGDSDADSDVTLDGITIEHIKRQ